MSPSLPQRIILVRHGHSAHVERPGWIDATGVHEWRERYDAAGILPNSAPPDDLVAETAQAACVMTSDLARAVASAERLAPGRPARVSPLLREMMLEVPQWVRTRLPLAAWEACIHLHWMVQERRGRIAGDDDLGRAAQAVTLLEEVAHDASPVVVVTHGAFRRLLDLELIANRWTAERRIGGYRNWSTWSYRR